MFLNFVFVFVYTVITAWAVRTSLHNKLNAEEFVSLNWRNELNKEITLVYPYFSVWLNSWNATTLVFYEQRNLRIRDSHVINLMANDWKEWISLLSCEPSLIAVIFIFLSFFLFLCNVFVLLFIFRADTSLFLFNLIFEKLILHIFLIIIIIIQCSGIFRNVPGCSGMFHVPDFIDGRGFLRL